MANTSFIERLCERFARGLLNHPRLAIGLLVLSLVGALACMPGLRFDFAPQSIYVGNDRLVADSEEFKLTFGHDEFIVLLLLKAEREPDVQIGRAHV